MITIEPDKFYTVPEVADYMRLSSAAVRELLSTRQLDARHIRPGSHPRIPGHSILAFVDAPKEGQA